MRFNQMGNVVSVLTIKQGKVLTKVTLPKEFLWLNIFQE